MIRTLMRHDPILIAALSGMWCAMLGLPRDAWLNAKRKKWERHVKLGVVMERLVRRLWVAGRFDQKGDLVQLRQQRKLIKSSHQS